MMIFRIFLMLLVPVLTLADNIQKDKTADDFINELEKQANTISIINAAKLQYDIFVETHEIQFYAFGKIFKPLGKCEVRINYYRDDSTRMDCTIGLYEKIFYEFMLITDENCYRNLEDLEFFNAINIEAERIINGIKYYSYTLSHKGSDNGIKIHRRVISDDKMCMHTDSSSIELLNISTESLWLKGKPNKALQPTAERGG